MRFFEEFKELAESCSDPVHGECVEFRNPVCGDEVRAQVVVEGETLMRFCYEARGCWPVHACLAWLKERFEGQKVTQATTFTIDTFLKEVDGVPASKRHAFTLSLRALHGAAAKAWIGQEKIGSKVGRPV